MRNNSWLMIMLSCCVAGSSGLLAAPRTAAPAPVARVASAHTAFGFDLLHQLAAKPGANVFISPSSIATALDMTYNGASAQTKAEMAKTLHVSGLGLDALNLADQQICTGAVKGDPGVKVAIANSLWAQQGFPFLLSFLQRNRVYYDAAVQNVDFGQPGTVERINLWAERRTNGKIKNLLPKLSPLTRLVLVNAVYFHGQWTDPFKKSATQPRDFTLQNGSIRKTPMMSRTGQYRYLKGDGFQAVRMPYGSGRFAMYIVLPSAKNGLPTLIEKMNTRNWSEWIKGMRPSEGAISLPRFKALYSQALNGSLEALGMRQAFDRRTADFRGMTGKRDLYISLVQHKAFVDVNEEGTEAAAATGVVMTLRSAMPQPGFQMVVDHPFLCAIRDDKTGEILFLGTIYNPA